jgi:hypothetical protein
MDMNPTSSYVPSSSSLNLVFSIQISVSINFAKLLDLLPGK